MWIRTKIVYFLLNKSNRLLAFSSKTDTRKSSLLSTIIRVIIPRKIGQPLTRISIASMFNAHCVEQAQGLLLTQAQAPLEAMSVADSLDYSATSSNPAFTAKTPANVSSPVQTAHCSAVAGTSPTGMISTPSASRRWQSATAVGAV